VFNLARETSDRLEEIEEALASKSDLSIARKELLSRLEALEIQAKQLQRIEEELLKLGRVHDKNSRGIDIIGDDVGRIKKDAAHIYLVERNSVKWKDFYKNNKLTDKKLDKLKESVEEFRGEIKKREARAPEEAAGIEELREDVDELKKAATSTKAAGPAGSKADIEAIREDIEYLKGNIVSEADIERHTSGFEEELRDIRDEVKQLRQEKTGFRGEYDLKGEIDEVKRLKAEMTSILNSYRHEEARGDLLLGDYAVKLEEEEPEEREGLLIRIWRGIGSFFIEEEGVEEEETEGEAVAKRPEGKAKATAEEEPRGKGYGGTIALLIIIMLIVFATVVYVKPSILANVIRPQASVAGNRTGPIGWEQQGVAVLTREEKQALCIEKHECKPRADGYVQYNCYYDEDADKCRCYVGDASVCAEYEPEQGEAVNTSMAETERTVTEDFEKPASPGMQLSYFIKALLPYKYYALIGIIALVLIIMVYELMGREGEDRKKASSELLKEGRGRRRVVSAARRSGKEGVKKEAKRRKGKGQVAKGQPKTRDVAEPVKKAKKKELQKPETLPAEPAGEEKGAEKQHGEKAAKAAAGEKKPAVGQTKETTPRVIDEKKRPEAVKAGEEKKDEEGIKDRPERAKGREEGKGEGEGELEIDEKKVDKGKKKDERIYFVR